MANLIPPDAKREVTIQYWIRVFVVWFVIIGLAFLVIAALKVPTYVLVQSQLTSFSGAYDDAQEKKEAFDEAQNVIREANILAGTLSSFATTTPLSELIDVLDGIGGDAVHIDRFAFEKDGTVVKSVSISGVASTRTALAGFSNDIEAHPWFLEAALPISNLAKDKDIAFNIDVIPAAKQE